MSLFTEAHQSFRQRVRQFVETRLAPNADRWEREAIFPEGLFRHL